LIEGNNEPKREARLRDSLGRLRNMERIPNLVFLNEQSYHLGDHGITVIGYTLWSRIGADTDPKSGDAKAWTNETNQRHNARYARELKFLKEEVADVRASYPDDRTIIMVRLLLL
jgi:hypothetical protein